MKEVESSSFRMPLMAFILESSGRKFRTFLSYRIFFLIVPLFVIVSMAIGITMDLRWLIVALMVIFLAIPMLMTLLYIGSAFHPGVFFNLTSHRLKIDDEGIKVITEIKMTPDVSEEYPENYTGEKELIEERITYIPNSSLGGVKVFSDFIIIEISPVSDIPQKGGWIYIPIKAFPDNSIIKEYAYTKG